MQGAHLVRGALLCNILVVQVACNLEDAALGAGDPEVAAAGVEDDLEHLGGSAEPNLAIVLRVGHGAQG